MSVYHSKYLLYGLPINPLEWGDELDEPLAGFNATAAPAGVSLYHQLIEGGKTELSFLAVTTEDVHEGAVLPLASLTTGEHWDTALRDAAHQFGRETLGDPGWFFVHDVS